MLGSIARALSNLSKSDFDADIDADWNEEGGLDVKVCFAGQSFTVQMDKDEVDRILAKRPKGDCK